MTNVPVGCVRDHPTGPLVVRVADAADMAACGQLDPARIVWIETPLHLAEGPFPDGAPLDVVVADPAREAASLYVLTRVRAGHPLRVTIAGRTGVARAARIAMALQLPVRLLVQQPAPEVLAEIHELLDVYLHGAQTTSPVEFLQSALAWWLHGDAPPPWVALELDPAWFPRVAGDLPDVLVPPAQDQDFVEKHFARLVEDGTECAACHHAEWCRGFFKWPDSSYRCDGVVRLLASLERSAAQLARDLEEAKSLDPESTRVERIPM